MSSRAAGEIALCRADRSHPLNVVQYQIRTSHGEQMILPGQHHDVGG